MIENDTEGVPFRHMKTKFIAGLWVKRVKGVPILLRAQICDLEFQCLNIPCSALEESQSDPHADLLLKLQTWNGDSLLAVL